MSQANIEFGKFLFFVAYLGTYQTSAIELFFEDS